MNGRRQNVRTAVIAYGLAGAGGWSWKGPANKKVRMLFRM